MDIKVYVKEGIYEVSRMHLTVRGQYLIGLVENMKEEVLIKAYKTESEAKASLEEIKVAIKEAMRHKSRTLVIELGEEEEGEEREERDGK